MKLSVMIYSHTLFRYILMMILPLHFFSGCTSPSPPLVYSADFSSAPFARLEPRYCAVKLMKPAAMSKQPAM